MLLSHVRVHRKKVGRAIALCGVLAAGCFGSELERYSVEKLGAEGQAAADDAGGDPSGGSGPENPPSPADAAAPEAIAPNAVAPNVGTTPGSLVWVEHVPNAYVGGLAFDLVNDSQMAVTGNFGGAITLGGRVVQAQGDSDVFLARFDKANGTLGATATFGGPGAEFPLGIVGAADGTFVLLGGYQHGSGNFGGAEVPAPSNDDINLVVADYTNAFGLNWQRTFAGVGCCVTGRPFDVDNGNGPVIAGTMLSSVDFGSGPRSTAGPPDAFFVRYGGSGYLAQVRQFEGGGAEAGLSTHVFLGTLVVAGTFNTSISLGGDPGFTSEGGTDIFIGAFSSASTLQWQLQIGGDGDEGGVYMAHDLAGHLYVCGTFQQSVRIGSTTLTSKGSSDIFVASVSAVGAVEWAVSFGGPANEVIRGLASSRTGDVALTGEFDTMTDLGGGPRIGAGQADAFILAINGADGSYRWDHAYGASQNDRGYGVIIDEDGDVYFNVIFMESVDFGNGPIGAAPNTIADSAILRYRR